METFNNDQLFEEFNEVKITGEDIAARYDGSFVIRRWVATLIDFLVLAGLILFFAAIPQLSENEMFQKMVGILTIIDIGLIIGYYLILEAFSGYTIGKYILQIKVIDSDCNPPGFVKNLIRTLMRLVEVNPFLMGGIPAGIAVIASKKRQRLGDMIAKTFVVKASDVLEEGVEGTKKTISIALTVAVIVFFVFGIISLGKSVGEGGKDKVFKSSEGSFQVTCSSKWIDNLKQSDNMRADLYISRLFDEMIIMGFANKDKKVVENLNTTLYANVVKNSLQKEMKNVKVSEFRNLTIGGHQAIQFDIYGRMEDVDVAMIVSVIKTQKGFYHFQAWTIKEKELENYDELTRVIHTFKEIEN